ncbi:33 kDa inner dynein arm light chain, axonemal-like [Stegodyphus dumicola]|uniref:33 kDa inner dynein arm light chain, axonemal-like n=1 Tax=Stegodyphus dumicola TaxID=202533 RepID=UPI0015AADD24|nr:33 kDa inner dynein arm light chain, axonemal-like [Stegodyphus dumicola]
MTDENKLLFVKYEEIPLPKEDTESRPATPKTEDSSSSSSDEEGEEADSLLFDPHSLDEAQRAEAVRNETIARVLDSILLPTTIERNGKMYLLRLSRQPISRSQLVELSKNFESCLKERQVRMQGYCPIRRELYDQLFDELIRQSTILCAERGSLLLRVRDEFRMTIAAYEQLYESGMEYGIRKATQAEAEKNSVEIQYNQLMAEIERAEKRKKDLEAEIKAEEQLSMQRIDMEKLRHEQMMEFLRKLNKQLKEQLSYLN